MEQTDIERLIAEELLGKKLDEDERRQLDEWLAENPAHGEWYAQIRNARFSSARYETYRHIDSDKAYENFLKKTHHHTTRWRRYVRAIAACLIPIFLVGGALWLKHNYTPKPQTVASSSTIVPGNTNAVLETADGESILLDNQTLARQPSITLNNSSVCTTTQGIKMMPEQAVARSTEKSGQNTLRTAKNGEFYITLEDGTVVHLNYNTTLRYPERFSSEERMVYLDGEAYFEVAKDPQRPFKVMTSNVTIRQYGTSFNVNTYSKRFTEVVLVEGSVGVFNGKNEYTMRPNERLRLDKSTSELSIKEVDVKPYIAWHKGRFIFDNESLGEIMETLSHWYDVDVVFDRPELRNLHFTGNMDRYGNLTPILKSISQTAELRIVLKNRTIYIYQ